MVEIFYGKLLIDLEQIWCGAMNTDAVFHQQQHELLAVHKGDGSLVWLSRFLDGSGAEVAGGDDQSLLVRSEAAAHLLNHRGQDVVLELPLLDLDGHLDSDHVTNHQGAPDIDTAVAAELGHLDHFETHLGQQLRDELLELAGFPPGSKGAA